MAVFTVAAEKLGDAGKICTAGTPIFIPSAFVLVGAEFSLVREGAVPASGMFVLSGGIDVLDDGAVNGGSLELEFENLAVSAPEFLEGGVDGKRSGSGDGKDLLLKRGGERHGGDLRTREE